jgi:DNA-binding MarR family transcriptional regulator
VSKQQNLEKLDSIIFYTIDKAMRSYRQFAQSELKRHGFTITIDQWLIIKCLLENPEMSQIEISERVFKDNASVTRIIELLVKAKYVSRKVNKQDRRRSLLTVTKLGEETIEAVNKLVLVYRAKALNGVSLEEIDNTMRIMTIISENCKK